MIPRPSEFEECHRTIIGTTGSGKTWHAIFHDFLAPPRYFRKFSKTVSIRERRIYFDTMAATHELNYQKNLNRYVKAYPGSVGLCHTVETFIDMWDAGCKFIIFAPEGDENTSRYRAKVNELVALIRRHQVHQTTRTREPVYIWFDEVSNLAPKQKESQVSFCFTRGRQVGIFSTAISQQPRLVARYIWFLYGLNGLIDRAISLPVHIRRVAVQTVLCPFQGTLEDHQAKPRYRPG
jgi:hypothetical protein